jgi:hypothetical protein
LGTTHLHIHQRHHLFQPCICHHDVVVKQHQIFAACHLQALVDRRRKPAIGRIADHGHRHVRCILYAAEISTGSIRRPIIDDDQLPRRPGVLPQRADALPGEFKLVPARDDDRSDAAGIVVHGGFPRC